MPIRSMRWFLFESSDGIDGETLRACEEESVYG